MVNEIPKICSVCGGNRVSYGKMETFGIKPYKSGRCYYCLDCGAYVGTHVSDPVAAMGKLATGRERYLRSMCHEEFEKHYASIGKKSFAYYMLSKEMGIKKEDCHFGNMDAEQLLKALDIMQNKWEGVVFR